MRWHLNFVKALGMAGLCLGFTTACVASASAQCTENCGAKAESSNMALVGYNDLQGRSAYQPVVEHQGDRWIAYIGAQDGKGSRLNTLTGQMEPNGTSIVDVTDPKHPQYIAHIPGEAKIPGGGAEFVRVCSANELPHAEKGKYYLLRDFGQTNQEIWDVTDPAKPVRIAVILTDHGSPHDIHKNWWECDTGIAYLIGGPYDWPTPPASAHHDARDHMEIYDLSNPAKPVFLRTFGLPGQEPGSKTTPPSVGVHGLISTGPKGNRLYIAYGNNAGGILEIVDRDKLLNGPKEATDENLLYPMIAEVKLPEDQGVHTAYPLLHMKIPEFAKQKDGGVGDFLAVMGEQDGNECRVGARQILRMYDVTTESRPMGIATWTVPEASGNFCSRGGRFGIHASNESFTPIYYNKILFIAHFNAGVRAVDVRDPYHPKEIGYYIPAVVPGLTDKSCVGEGAEQHCKIAIQTNNVEVDDRGYIYIVDRNNTGMHILELTGSARQIADFKNVEGSSSRK